MSQMSLLDQTVNELRGAAQALIGAADGLVALFSHQEDTEKPPENTTVIKPISLEQVRSVLADKSRAGHTAKVRELLEKHGAAKLSEINSTHYPALLAEAEAWEDG